MDWLQTSKLILPVPICSTKADTAFCWWHWSSTRGEVRPIAYVLHKCDVYCCLIQSAPLVSVHYMFASLPVPRASRIHSWRPRLSSATGSGASHISMEFLSTFVTGPLSIQQLAVASTEKNEDASPGDDTPALVVTIPSGACKNPALKVRQEHVCPEGMLQHQVNVTLPSTHRPTLGWQRVVTKMNSCRRNIQFLCEHNDRPCFLKPTHLVALLNHSVESWTQMQPQTSTPPPLPIFPVSYFSPTLVFLSARAGWGGGNKGYGDD